jgi:iron complex transport system permease protein
MLEEENATMKVKILISFAGTLVLIFMSLTLNITETKALFLLPRTDSEQFLLLHVRLPRTLLALFSGAGYAISGLVLQTYLRTPLADANLIGLGSFAALGSLLGLYFGITSSFGLILLSICCCFVLPGLYFLFIRYHLISTSLVLIGLCITTFVQGLLSLLIYFIHREFPLNEVLFWLFGSFNHHTLKDIALILPFVCLGASLLYIKRHSLNILCLSPEMIYSFGICQKRLGITLILGVCFLVAPIISLTGIIGFIGIIGPHLAYLLWRTPPSQLIIPSAIIGGTLTLMADLVVRILPLSYELNVGILVSLLATPFFIFLIIRHSYHA